MQIIEKAVNFYKGLKEKQSNFSMVIESCYLPISRTIFVIN